MPVINVPGELLVLSKQKIDRSSPLPRHAQLKAILLSAISSGEWQPGMKIPAETEIARMLNVSKMTANRALTDLADEGVLVRELGIGTFVVEPPGGATCTCNDRAARRAQRVLRIVTDGPAANVADNEYLCSLLLAIRTALSPTDAVIQISQIPGTDYVRVFDENPEERWVIIAPLKHDIDGLKALGRARRGAVVLGASWPNVGISSIDSDNRGGAALAVHHLVNLGHRSIGLLYADPESSNTIDRVTGFQCAMESFGLSTYGEFIVDAHDDMGIRPDVKHDMAAILGSGKGPTAWIAAGPYVAMGLLELAGELGLCVPKDLSIIGFDYPAALANSQPALTTVGQPLAEMGASAALLVMSSQLDLVNDQLKCILAVRESTTVPPASNG
jgi:DNA-binding LacI/PurR family transcriptional regulator